MAMSRSGSFVVVPPPSQEAAPVVGTQDWRTPTYAEIAAGLARPGDLLPGSAAPAPTPPAPAPAETNTTVGREGSAAAAPVVDVGETVREEDVSEAPRVQSSMPAQPAPISPAAPAACTTPPSALATPASSADTHRLNRLQELALRFHPEGDGSLASAAAAESEGLAAQQQQQSPPPPSEQPQEDEQSQPSPPARRKSVSELLRRFDSGLAASTGGAGPSATVPAPLQPIPPPESAVLGTTPPIGEPVPAVAEPAPGPAAEAPTRTHPRQRHGVVVATDVMANHPEYAPNQADSEVAVRRASLRHVPRDPNFRGSQHDACGIKVALSQSEQARLQASEQAAASREGRVLNDDPDLLLAILKHHRANATGKARIFRNFFEQWHKGDLRVLTTILDDQPLETLQPPGYDASGGGLEADSANPWDFRDPSRTLSDHPFVLRQRAWRDISLTHGDQARECLAQVLNSSAPTFDRELAWAQIVSEFQAGGGSSASGEG